MLHQPDQLTIRTSAYHNKAALYVLYGHFSPVEKMIKLSEIIYVYGNMEEAVIAAYALMYRDKKHYENRK